MRCHVEPIRKKVSHSKGVFESVTGPFVEWPTKEDMLALDAAFGLPCFGGKAEDEEQPADDGDELD